MKLTQCQRIIRHLQEIGPIDDLTAYSEYGIRRLAARIHDLKERKEQIRRGNALRRL